MMNQVRRIASAVPQHVRMLLMTIISCFRYSNRRLSNLIGLAWKIALLRFDRNPYERVNVLFAKPHLLIYNVTKT